MNLAREGETIEQLEAHVANIRAELVDPANASPIAQRAIGHLLRITQHRLDIMIAERG